MNTMLDITGGFLYLALSILLMPLFLLVDVLLFSVIAYRNSRILYRRMARSIKRYPVRLPRTIDLALKRGWVYLMPNRH
jgi:hypothetical protein